MLKIFFKLNAPSDPDVEIREFQTIKELLEHFTTSSTLKNALFNPDSISDVSNNLFKDHEFKNVSFSKTKFEDLTMRDCRFEDCLFIGSQFIGCEFHNCKFVNCNTYKISITDCYIDPKSFHFSNIYKKQFSNVGTHLFHKLFVNSNQTYQSAFAGDAEVSFKIWKRHQEKYSHAKKMEKVYDGFCERTDGRVRYLLYLAKDYFFYAIAGYGHRPVRFAFVSLIFMFITALLIHFGWQYWGLESNGDSLSKKGFIESLYYAVVVATTLGFGDITPTKTPGRVLTMFISAGGLLWLSLLAAVLIKRFIR